MRRTHISMTLVVVTKKNTHAMTLVDPCVVFGKNTHAMTLDPCVVCEKNTRPMTLAVVSEKSTYFNDTAGSICGM